MHKARWREAVFHGKEKKVKNEDFSILIMQNHCRIRFADQKSSFYPYQ